jgi:Zn finger protein HypA/HybF involved in hydrogenase expression
MYTEQELMEAVKTSKSIRQIVIKLGINNAQHYAKIRNKIHAMNLDISHFTHKNHGFGYVQYDNDKMFSENSICRTGELKTRILKLNLLNYSCSECNISDWRNKDITLELDHINGITTDNRLENLRFLCPNCHSQTPTYCGRNQKKVRKRKFCPDCNIEVAPHATRCKKCFYLSNRKVERPSKEQLEKDVWSNTLEIVSKKYGVSKNVISKWAKQYNITRPLRGYWNRKNVAK